jgi:hypothetical protein
MSFDTLDTVVMTVDLPSRGLKCGDVGAIVQVYPGDALEVEFVTASGHTHAVTTLGTHQVRRVGSRDLLAVRQLNAL